MSPLSKVRQNEPLILFAYSVVECIDHLRVVGYLAKACGFNPRMKRELSNLHSVMDTEGLTINSLN